MIEAQISDPSDVAWARIYYREYGSAVWTYVDMTRPLVYTFVGTLGPFDDPGQVAYQIRAGDMLGNTSESEVDYLTVNDCGTNPTEVEVFLPLLMRTHSSRQIIFSDDFSDSGSGWDTNENENARLAYEAGEYQVWVKNDDYLYRPSAPNVLCENCRIDVKARYASASYNSYGILFAYSDSDYYAFIVWPDSQTCDVMKHSAEGWEVLGRTTSDYVMQTNNALAVEWQAPAIRTYVNGQLIHDLTDGSFSSVGEVGVIVNRSGDARFDDFVVSGL